MRRLVTLVVLAAVSTSVSADWPQWRGPAGTGVAAGETAPLRWSEQEGIAWRASLDGVGLSSPIVSGDRVFVASQQGEGGRREGNHPTLVQGGGAREAGERPLAPSSDRDRVAFVLEAFARVDGRRLWSVAIEADGELPPVHEKHNLASASPVTDGERVYAVFGTGQVVAVDTSGRRVWSRNLAVDHGPFRINWGHGSSPAVYRDLVIVPCFHETSSYLVALDLRSGKTRWRTDRGRNVLSYSTPLIVPTEAGDELVLNTSEGIEAYRPATGEPLWRFEQASRFPIPVPVHHDGVVYASRGYRSGPYVAIRAGGRGEVTASHVQWQVPTGAPYIASLVHHDGLLYMAGDVGVVTCVDAKTGERVWQERLDAIFTASPVVVQDRLYLLSETGETIVVRTGRTPEVLARNRIDGRLLASPAVSDGMLFLRTDDRLLAIGEPAGSGSH